VVERRQGLADLVRSWSRLPHVAWFAALAIPPAGILVTLFPLTWLASPDFRPQLFVVGLGFGLVAGFFEEIGWTGFAYPRLSLRFGWLRGAALLGVLWGVWHLPVVDSLGAASPHGRFWPLFFVAFVALVAAIRIVIGWLYTNTASLLLAQLMHASSTGFLVVLGASRASPGEEAVWYLCYAGLLWMVVAALVVRSRGKVLAAA
jgi:membrane protease YdiL (CAAX protease family)